MLVVAASLVLLVLSFVMMPGRHLLIAIALSAALFFVAHVSPTVVIGVYLAVYVGLNVALFGLAALALKGRLGPVFRLLGFKKA